MERQKTMPQRRIESPEMQGEAVDSPVSIVTGFQGNEQERVLLKWKLAQRSVSEIREQENYRSTEKSRQEL